MTKPGTINSNSSSNDESPAAKHKNLHAPTLAAMETYLKSSQEFLSEPLEEEDVWDFAAAIHTSTVKRMKKTSPRMFIEYKRETEDGISAGYEYEYEYEHLYNEINQEEEYAAVASDFSKSVVNGARNNMASNKAGSKRHLNPKTVTWLKKAAGMHRDSMIYTANSSASHI